MRISVTMVFPTNRALTPERIMLSREELLKEAADFLAVLSTYRKYHPRTEQEKQAAEGIGQAMREAFYDPIPSGDEFQNAGAKMKERVGTFLENNQSASRYIPMGLLGGAALGALGTAWWNSNKKKEERKPILSGMLTGAATGAGIGLGGALLSAGSKSLATGQTFHTPNWIKKWFPGGHQQVASAPKTLKYKPIKDKYKDYQDANGEWRTRHDGTEWVKDQPDIEYELDPSKFTPEHQKMIDDASNAGQRYKYTQLGVLGSGAVMAGDAALHAPGVGLFRVAPNDIRGHHRRAILTAMMDNIKDSDNEAWKAIKDPKAVVGPGLRMAIGREGGLSDNPRDFNNKPIHDALFERGPETKRTWAGRQAQRGLFDLFNPRNWYGRLFSKRITGATPYDRSLRPLLSPEGVVIEKTVPGQIDPALKEELANARTSYDAKVKALADAQLKLNQSGPATNPQAVTAIQSLTKQQQDAEKLVMKLEAEVNAAKASARPTVHQIKAKDLATKIRTTAEGMEQYKGRTFGRIPWTEMTYRIPKGVVGRGGVYAAPALAGYLSDITSDRVAEERKAKLDEVFKHLYAKEIIKPKATSK